MNRLRRTVVVSALVLCCGMLASCHWDKSHKKSADASVAAPGRAAVGESEFCIQMKRTIDWPDEGPVASEFHAILDRVPPNLSNDDVDEAADMEYLLPDHTFVIKRGWGYFTGSWSRLAKIPNPPKEPDWVRPGLRPTAPPPTWVPVRTPKIRVAAVGTSFVVQVVQIQETMKKVEHHRAMFIPDKDSYVLVYITFLDPMKPYAVLLHNGNKPTGVKFDAAFDANDFHGMVYVDVPAEATAFDETTMIRALGDAANQDAFDMKEHAKQRATDAAGCGAGWPK